MYMIIDNKNVSEICICRAVSSAGYYSMQSIRWRETPPFSSVCTSCLCRIEICSPQEMSFFFWSEYVVILMRSKAIVIEKRMWLERIYFEIVHRGISGGFSGGQRPAESFSVIGFLRTCSGFSVMKSVEPAARGKTGNGFMRCLRCPHVFRGAVYFISPNIYLRLYYICVWMFYVLNKMLSLRQ